MSEESKPVFGACGWEEHPAEPVQHGYKPYLACACSCHDDDATCPYCGHAHSTHPGGVYCPMPRASTKGEEK